MSWAEFKVAKKSVFLFQSLVQVLTSFGIDPKKYRTGANHTSVDDIWYCLAQDPVYHGTFGGLYIS